MPAYPWGEPHDIGMARAGDCVPGRARIRGGVRHRGAVVSTVRIPADPWPFRNHRTWAEVIRTEQLLAKIGSPDKMTPQEKAEFGQLIIKARRNNPPPDRGPEAA